MEAIIRTAYIEDLDEISELVQASVQSLQKKDYDSNTIVQAMELITGFDVLINNKQFFVAEYDGCIVGCGGFSTMQGDKTCAELKSYFILPEHARKGISTQLLEHSVIKCIKAGVSFLKLSATLTGVPFYKKNGFTVAREFDQVLSNGDSFRMVEMERIIAP